MSGGVNALKGFDYQATVILDRIFEHFDRHGKRAFVRPEGVDDLDLTWLAEDGSQRRQYEQIKKPREDQDGNRKPQPWSLRDVIGELIPNTIAHLSGSSYKQVWILGDKVDNAVRSLVVAGEHAPANTQPAYWRVVHTLARNHALNSAVLDSQMRTRIRRQATLTNLPADQSSALARLRDNFRDVVRSVAVSDELTQLYSAELARLHDCLPSVLSRTSIISLYGSEAEVARRVQGRLMQQYSLQRPTVENTLFRNLRGFINDISKQPGRTFNREEFEIELRCVWPTMLRIKDPPPLSGDHVPRRNLSERFAESWSGKALEAIGVSGSGKTMLASEVLRRSHNVDPDRFVYYAEVRPDVRLRDALAGTAFHLRRLGISGPFGISVESAAADEDILVRLARSFSAMAQGVLLLVDLVEGTCSPAFARDLATFVRALSTSTFRIAVFGQESAFRELNQLERGMLGVSRLDIRGFNFEEFVLFVSRHHRSLDRAKLWSVFERVTAGRAMGMYANLARVLVSAPSLEAMSELAARPAEDILPYAEQQRFARISESSRAAAEKLVCFALPFRRRDAVEIFPTDNIGSAIREMLALGLLRPNDEESFEMHETVRAGLEGTIALEVRRFAHQALATWYRRQGLIAAEVLHLERSNNPSQAQERAREAFLRGEQWAALASFVAERKLVSPQEVIHVMAGPAQVGDGELFAEILHGLDEPPNGLELLQVLREQSERFFTDYPWAWTMAKAILVFDPTRLHDLILFCIEASSDSRQREVALATVMVRARQNACIVGPSTIEFYGTAPRDVKRLLLPFMLMNGRREALRQAFNFIVSDEDPPRERRESPLLSLDLRSEDPDDVIEVLAALPDVAVAEMLTAQSPLFGALAPILWRQRRALRPLCVDILRTAGMEAKVLESAIRVLVFLAEPSVCDLCEALAKRGNGAVHGFAALAPSLVPAQVDGSRYEARVLDRNLMVRERSAALSVLAFVGADLGAIYKRLKVAEDSSDRHRVWDFLFLQYSAIAPFPDAIPLLEKHLWSADARSINIYLTALTNLGELAVAESTAMLVRALSHENPSVRRSAAMALGLRRSRAALPRLLEQYEKEEDEGQSMALATAIVASGPQSVTAFRSHRSDRPSTLLWQCILATRLPNSTFAERLVAIAIDRTLNWQLRRTAIWAAGRLPFEAALERILPAVMRERSPLTIDHHQSYQGHAALSWLLLNGAGDLFSLFVSGRTRFVMHVADILEAIWEKILSRSGLPAETQAAEWLFDRLSHKGWPANEAAADAVLNELHLPLLHSAVLRSLRRAGRSDLLEAELPRSYHVWFAIKCLLERLRTGERGPQLAARLRSLVQNLPFGGEAILQRVIQEFDGSRPSVQGGATPVLNERTADDPHPFHLSYGDAVLALTGGKAEADVKATAPIIMGAVTQVQFEHLATLAEPVNDHLRISETYIPQITFTRDGHTVARRTVTTGTSEPPGSWIRPALAAANRFGLQIRWHEELLSGVFANTYAERLITCLELQGDRDRFYEEVYSYPDLLLPHLCKAAHHGRALRYVDARMIPFLSMFSSSGTDEIFAGLCALAHAIDLPAIDRVLSSLLQRWTQRFDLKSSRAQHRDNPDLWRGFESLVTHPRFNHIRGWQPLLTQVLRSVVNLRHQQEVARVLERDPRSYLQIESLLFKSVDWEHLHVDEIDHLNGAAERLFWMSCSE